MKLKDLLNEDGINTWKALADEETFENGVRFGVGALYLTWVTGLEMATAPFKLLNIAIDPKIIVLKEFLDAVGEQEIEEMIKALKGQSTNE